VSHVLILHLFKVFKEQDGIECVVASALKPFDNLALTDNTLLTVGDEPAGLAQLTQCDHQIHTPLRIPIGTPKVCSAFPIPENQEDGKESQETNIPWSQAGSRTGGRGEDYEVRYEAGKIRNSATAFKNALKKVGNSRKRIERSMKTQLTP
jgi:hypothetical protein